MTQTTATPSTTRDDAKAPESPGHAIVLRPARSTDAGKLGAMISAAVAAHDWKPHLHSGAEDIAFAARMIDRGWVSVAEIDWTVAGFVARNGHEILSLYVSDAAQGLGVGKALLDAAKAQSDRLELWTFQSNRGAQRFYKREGFIAVEETDGARNEEGLPDIRFEWSRTP